MLEIVQVNVGRPALLGEVRGRQVYSSIRKSPVASSIIAVGPEGLDGDEQADTRVIRGNRVHGGPLKAVYAYPMEHIVPWVQELGIDIGPASFGENLTIVGATEVEVYIGDTFRCGEVELRVTKPRRPCYKLPMHLGVPDAAERMMANGRSGWYFTVVTPGELDTSGVLELIDREVGAPTVAEVFARKVREDPTVPGMPEDA